jgi:hypothetical protein
LAFLFERKKIRKYPFKHTEKERCHTETKEDFVDLKKVSVFEENSKSFLGFVGNLRNL